MTRRRNKSTKSASGPLRETNRPTSSVLNDTDTTSTTLDKPIVDSDAFVATKIEGIEGIKSLLDDNDENTQPQPSTSKAETFINDASALYNELDTFRQKWKRELEVIRIPTSNQGLTDAVTTPSSSEPFSNDKLSSCNETLRESFSATTNSQQNDPKQIYALAKKLFLIGVGLEQDDLHHESIRYYKQAVHLCPDIEKQIFREQCEASAKLAKEAKEIGLTVPKDKSGEPNTNDDNEKADCGEEKVPLIERIRQNLCDDLKQNERAQVCKPIRQMKPNSLHISALPKELILQIIKSVCGSELDLASLETLGMVCRHFYLLSRDQTLWRDICHRTWGNAIHNMASQRLSNEREDEIKNKENNSIKSNSIIVDWRQIYLTRPRVNFDGIYISRTRYIRVGDAGFQDLSYRPFHVVRYYRYLRFFPDRRVLILTTNEEPERIVPIFRHAMDAKHFSSELSILEGSYEYTNADEISVTAEKDFRNIATTLSSRRQAKFQWSRQTPLTQRFNLKFALKTSESRPYRNNLLKWLDYNILTKLETGQELTTFDLSSDTFPNLQFYRVRRAV